MSSRPDVSYGMRSPEGNDAQMEERLRRVAAVFAYPETPDLAAGERRRLAGRAAAPPARSPRRMAYVLAVLFLLLAAALVVSPARARVLDWIRIGAVRIFFLPTPTVPAPVPSVTPTGDGGSALLPVVTAAPVPSQTPTLVQSVLDLAGETTLAEAQEQAGFPILLPVYPADLGEPDHVFFQQFGDGVVVLVWMDPQDPKAVRLALSETDSRYSVFEKYDPQSVQDTSVSGSPAVWVRGEYIVVTRSGDTMMRRLIRQGHTLIWSDGSMTFRLETDADLETAVRIAESIR